MTAPTLILGAPEWWTAAASLTALAFVLIAWSYARGRGKPAVRIACAALKALAFAALAMILLEPLLSGSRPRRGANAFACSATDRKDLQRFPQFVEIDDALPRKLGYDQPASGGELEQSFRD